MLLELLSEEVLLDSVNNFRRSGPVCKGSGFTMLEGCLSVRVDR